MKISYNWLKKYVETQISVAEAAQILTDTGLEVESVEKTESIKGGLKGFVSGKVTSKQKHPNADKLSLTTVDIGAGSELHIVCGAPNVDAGQTVIVATEGTVIHSEKGDFVIKKSKIRGELSEGMICAEDEMGIGKSHDGILVLGKEYKPGTPAADIFGVETDYLLEIGLTPNRSDAMSHIGVARDLAAKLSLNHFLKNEPKNILVDYPKIDAYSKKSDFLHIPVEIHDPEACPRYAGVCVIDIKVGESPEWLKNSLLSIGQTPINNVVDVTNFVLHEMGQPLHAFDADKIAGKKVIVRKAPKDTEFTTLDGIKRKLSGNELMICDAEKEMCIAGVFGGIHSGVTSETQNIFLESAYFNPVSIRKTARYHDLSTDASYRFERGINPETVCYALKRAAMLIIDIAGGQISGDIVDVYPKQMQKAKVQLSYANLNRLSGCSIAPEVVGFILKSLDIEIASETPETLELTIPLYRTDVTREADVIEEILRIYGFNNIPVPEQVRSSLSYAPKPDKEKLRNRVSDFLSAKGFSEAMNNSLTNNSLYDLHESNTLVSILNPLSNELNCLRQNLLFGLLSNISYNANRQANHINLYEFGRIYFKQPDEKTRLDYTEKEVMAFVMSGSLDPAVWNNQQKSSDIFRAKGVVENILQNLGIRNFQVASVVETESASLGMQVSYLCNDKEIARVGSVKTAVLKKHDVRFPVFYGEINWELCCKLSLKATRKFTYKDIPKFPRVRRDLAMVLDSGISYADIESIARKTEKNILKEMELFDVYKGDKLPTGKKSYAVSFILQDELKTLTDDRIEKAMAGLIESFQKELGAELR